ncbi:MAG: hypothetical protein IT204_23185 [Fimbriimonadaceae bacterium]|nr:hypothetical protein [Fimbriimonadaceae bacterium]
MRSDPDLQVKRLLDEAFQAFERGDDEAARRGCREALALNPDSSTAHSLMGLLYEREGRLGEASSEIGLVLTQNPESEAERDTLRRLRGQGSPPMVDPDVRSNRIITTLAVCAGLVVLIGFLAVARWANGAINGVRNTPLVAAANAEQDLETAREAFQQGRYEIALEAAARVLKADPDNNEAKQIYARSKAFLDGTAQPPAPATPAAGTPAAPVAPAPVVVQPAIRPPAGAPASAGAPAAYPPPASGLPDRRASSLGSLPSPSARVAPVVPGGTGSAVQPRTYSPQPRPLVGYDPTYLDRLRQPAPRAVPRTPDSYEQLNPPDRPASRPSATTIGGSADQGGGGGSAGSAVRVEVKPRNPSDPSAPAPEVTPDDTTTPASGSAPRDRRIENPAVADMQEQQRRLEAAKARQRAAASRRAEQERGR